MGERRGTLLMTLGLAAAVAACGGAEKTVVDQYFGAVKARDNQTLSSFAAVNFDKPVESWRIIQASEEKTEPAVLPELVAKLKDLEAQVAANKKAASGYSLNSYTEIEKVQEARRKGAAVPAGLSAVAAKWDEFNQKDRELKKQLAVAKDALEKERRNVRLSVGDVEGVDTLQGEMVSKQVEVEVTVKDEQPQPYVMTLRRYNLKREGPRVVSRWVVQALQPKV